MANRLLRRIAVTVFAVSLPTIASAFTVYDNFGAFPDATWGGSGIPNDAVAASKQFLNGSNTIRIAMSATERYSNPAVGDNGEAIYTAGTGSNCGVATDPLGCPSSSQGALWNWNYFVDVSGGGKLTDYQIDLYYDLDPAGPHALGDLTGLGRIDITKGITDSATPLATLAEGSQNNLFGFLSSGFPPYVFAPGGTFDPNVAGNYQFVLVISTTSGFMLDSVAMEVNVVPVPATVWLFGSAIGLLGWIRRRTRVT